MTDSVDLLRPFSAGEDCLTEEEEDISNSCNENDGQQKLEVMNFETEEDSNKPGSTSIETEKILAQQSLTREFMTQTTTAVEIMSAVANGHENRAHFTCKKLKATTIGSKKSNGHPFGRAFHGLAYDEKTGYMYIHGGIYFKKHYYSNGFYKMNVNNDKESTYYEDNLHKLQVQAHQTSSKFQQGTNLRSKNSGKVLKTIKSIMFNNHASSAASLWTQASQSSGNDKLSKRTKQRMKKEMKKAKRDESLVFKLTRKKNQKRKEVVRPLPRGEHTFLYRSFYLYEEGDPTKGKINQEVDEEEYIAQDSPALLVHDSPTEIPLSSRRSKGKKGNLDIKEGNYLVVFGGKSEHFTLLSDMYLFDLKKEKWMLLRSPNPPQPLAGHSCIYVPHLDWMVLYGGYSKNGHVYGHVMRFSFRSRKWQCLYYDDDSLVDVDSSSLQKSQLDMIMMNKPYKKSPRIPTENMSHSKDAPLRRYYHSADLYYPTKNCMDAKMIIISGKDANYTEMNDIWFFEIAKKKWELFETYGENPLPIYGHATTLIHHQLYLFGGKYGFSNHLSCLNLVTGQWNRILFDDDIPPGIAFHSMTAVFPRYEFNQQMFRAPRFKEGTTRHIAAPSPPGSLAYFKEPKLVVIGGETETGVLNVRYDIYIENEVTTFKKRMRYHGYFHDIFIHCSESETPLKKNPFLNFKRNFGRSKKKRESAEDVKARLLAPREPSPQTDIDVADPTPQSSLYYKTSTRSVINNNPRNENVTSDVCTIM